MRVTGVLLKAGVPDLHGNVYTPEALQAVADKHPELEYDAEADALRITLEIEEAKKVTKSQIGSQFWNPK